METDFDLLLIILTLVAGFLGACWIALVYIHKVLEKIANNIHTLYGVLNVLREDYMKKGPSPDP